MGGRVDGCLPHGILVGTVDHHDSRTLLGDGLPPRTFRDRGHVDARFHALLACRPRDGAAMIAGGGTHDDAAWSEAPVGEQAVECERYAEDLERVQAEATGLVLQEDVRKAERSGEPRQVPEWRR